MNKILEQFKNKRFKTYISIFLGVFALTAYFIVSLTFQYIGNNKINTNLIIGFTFGLLGTILISLYLIFIFSQEINTSIQTILFVLIILGWICSILSMIFGPIGYLEMKV